MHDCDVWQQCDAIQCFRRWDKMICNNTMRRNRIWHNAIFLKMRLDATLSNAMQCFRKWDKMRRSNAMQCYAMRCNAMFLKMRLNATQQCNAMQCNGMSYNGMFQKMRSARMQFNFAIVRKSTLHASLAKNVLAPQQCIFFSQNWP